MKSYNQIKKNQICTLISPKITNVVSDYHISEYISIIFSDARLQSKSYDRKIGEIQIIC